MRLLKSTGVWPRLIVVALAGALAFTAGSVFTAYSQPDSTTIHTCVHRVTGEMRYVSSSSDCSRYESPVSWESTSTADFDDVYVNEGQENSITSAMIVDGQVMTEDLADASVNSAKIEDGSIGSDDLGSGSVGADELQDDSVNGDKLADDSVNSGHIQDGEVMTDDLADDSVNSDKLADNSVNSDKIEDGTIIEDDLNQDVLDFIEGQGALSGWDVINSEFVELTTAVGDNQASILLPCPTGTTLISGGGFADHPLAFLVRSYPHPTDPNTWEVFYRYQGTDPLVTANVRAYAICVDN